MNSENNSEEIKGSPFWKSLKELANDPEVNEAKANEFMQGVTDDFDIGKLSNVSRRKFLALLSASVAFATASCTTSRDKGEIVPYNKKPEEITPGIPNFYASTCTGCSNACGTIVKTREGRPIKVDGNPQHPVNQGKICAIGQASVLNLYDPNRLKNPIKVSGGSSAEVPWSGLDDAVIAALNNAQNSGKQIAIITNKIVSPTENKVLNDFKAKYPNTKVYSYEFFNEDLRNNAWQKTYGTGTTFPLINWDQAKVVLSLEGDFLAGEGHTIENVRLFALNRDAFNRKLFNKFYAVEGAMSATGMNADQRIRLRPDAQFEFVMGLLNELNDRLNKPLSLSGNYSLNDIVKKYGLSDKAVRDLVNDLYDNRGAEIVYAGSKLPEEVHIAVNALNEILGNSKLYNTNQYQFAFTTSASNADWEDLVNKMNNGTVGVVIHYDTNPVYHLPQDYGYEQALRKVPLSVSLVEQEDETSALSTYTAPINHDLESWGDYNSRTGVISFQQPVIYPLYSTRQKQAVLLVWISGNKAAWKENLYHDYLMSSWQNDAYPKMNNPVDFQTFWFTALENGVVQTSQNISAQQRSFNRSAVATAGNKQAGNGYILYIKNNYSVGDGRYANNGWLQELPHPVSKIVWDNYAAVSPATAKELGLGTHDKLEITAGNKKLEFPVFVQPGTADKVIVVEAGYGRTKTGEVGSGVGVNANLLMSKDPQLTSFLLNNIQVGKAGGSYKLVSTQEQHSLDDNLLKDLHLKRGIIRQGTIEEYKNYPNFLEKEKREQPSVTKDVEYPQVKWGMGIDLNKCIGCNACITACDVENNIPVVGKDQVDMGRIMHWFRVDRYYSGTPDDPTVYNQPMLCQHCDNAPCENVCPVAATSHSPDGLNQMAYNRCVGTRYCSNNCPYKVRRFNFFNFRDHFEDGYYQQEPIELVYNPEVTVRSRGVMEKCTFCVQRIMYAREKAIEENRPLRGTDVETACQQACPSRAIVFGDVNNPESEVSKHRVHELGYHVLAEINTRPNITYLAKLWNTSSEDKA